MLIRFDAHPPSKPRRTAETSGRNSVAPVISCVSCDCRGRRRLADGVRPRHHTGDQAGSGEYSRPAAE